MFQKMKATAVFLLPDMVDNYINIVEFMLEIS